MRPEASRTSTWRGRSRPGRLRAVSREFGCHRDADPVAKANRRARPHDPLHRAAHGAEKLRFFTAGVAIRDVLVDLDDLRRVHSPSKYGPTARERSRQSCVVISHLACGPGTRRGLPPYLTDGPLGRFVAAEQRARGEARGRRRVPRPSRCPEPRRGRRAHAEEAFGPGGGGSSPSRWGSP